MALHSIAAEHQTVASLNDHGPLECRPNSFCAAARSSPTRVLSPNQSPHMRPRSVSPPHAHPGENWSVGNGLDAPMEQERCECKAMLTALRADIEVQVRRKGDGLLAALLEKGRQECEATAAVLRSELDARLAHLADGRVAMLLEKVLQEREDSFAKLRVDIDTRLAAREDGPITAMLERERSERDASIAALQDDMESRLAQVAEDLVAHPLNREHAASMEALRSETKVFMDSLRDEIAQAQERSPIVSLLQRERDERAASLVTLRGEVDARLAQMAALSEQDSQDHRAAFNALQQEMHVRFGKLEEDDPAANLEPKSQNHHASLEDLRSEMDTRFAQLEKDCRVVPSEHDREQQEASLDSLRHEIKTQIEQLSHQFDARIAHITEISRQPPALRADSAITEDGPEKADIGEVKRFLRKQKADVAHLEVQMDNFRQDINSSVQVLKLQVAQVEQVSSNLDMDIRMLKEANWTTLQPVSPRLTCAAPTSQDHPGAPAVHPLRSLFPSALAQIQERLEAAQAAARPPASSPEAPALHTPFHPQESLAHPTAGAGWPVTSFKALETPATQKEAAVGRLPSSGSDNSSRTDGEAPTEGNRKPEGMLPRTNDNVQSLRAFSLENTGRPPTEALPGLRPPSCVPMSLNEYLLQDLRADKVCEHPVGYKGETDGDKLVLTHRGSGVKLWAAPLQLAGALDTDHLLYYYTDRESFHAICDSSEVLVTLLERTQRDRTEFGCGVCMTIHPPEYFGTKSAILVNLYSNATDRPSQLLHIEPYCGMADYCVPFLVPMCHVTDVMHGATPKMCFGAGYTVSGEYIRAGRDIRVVSIDVIEDTIRRLEDPVPGIRTKAVRSMRELAARGDPRVVTALLRCGGTDRDRGVKAAAVGALGEVAARGDAPTCQALLRYLGAGDDVQVRESAALALGKVAQKGDKQVVEALARCLDGDRDRSVRASAAFVLGKVATREDVRAVEALTYRLEDDDEDERVAAIAGRALKRLGMEVDMEDDDTLDENSCVLS